jgi:membrane protease subunit (stomatin/prohibitin family)
MPLGRDRRQRRRRVAAAGAAGAYAVHKHHEHEAEQEEQQQQQADGYQTEQPQAQGAPVEQEAGSPDDSVAKLTQLKSLLDSGALTQQEFDAEKQKIIGA